MTIQTVLIAALLGIGVLTTALACVGVWAMPQFYARLHYLGLATSLGALALAGAIAVEEGSTGATTKAVIAALVVAVTGPTLTHATARAAWLRAAAGNAPAAAAAGPDDAAPVGEG